VRNFAATIVMRPVTFPAVAVDPFYNVNTPDDVAAARALATRTRPEGEP
jgi:molybdopterin-guanine dinucleotide biosynthesis protein A